MTTTIPNGTLFHHLRMLGALVSALAVMTLSGEERHWAVDADGETTTASNWTDATVPAAGDDLVFDKAQTARHTVTVKANDGSVARFGAISGTSDYPSQWLSLGCNMTFDELAGFFGCVSLETDRTLTAEPSDGLATIPRLRAALGAAVAVASGSTLVVTNLSSDSCLEKKGAGTLRLTQTDGAAHRVTVTEGTLELDLSDDAGAVVGDPYIHVDATATDTFVLEYENGTNYITRWNDVRGKSGAPYFTTTVYYPQRPFLRPAGGFYATNVVDCGALSGDSGNIAGDVEHLGPSASLQLSQSSSRIREAFAVFCDTGAENVKETFGFIFGSGDYHFHRQSNGSLFGSGSAYVRMGDIRINDCAVSDTHFVQGSELKVVSVGTTANVSIDSIARDREWYRLGGIRYGEVILYTNALTIAERSRVNRYLMKKWLRPSEREKYGLVEARVAAAGALGAPDGKTVAVRKVTATANALVKRGAGTLEIGTLCGASSAAKVAVTVAEGDVRFAAPSNAVTANPQPAPEPFFHFDADKDSTLTCDDDGNVTRWNDATGGVRYATATAGHTPKRLPGICNGKAVLDFGPYYNSGAGQFMTICNRQGDAAKQGWLRELFLVWRWNPGTNPSPFPVGGDSYQGFHWGERGVLMTTSGGGQGYYGLWTVDGVSVPGNQQVASNDFHVVSVALDANLAERRYLFNDRGNTRTGGGQLAEVIGYNRRLTPQERHDT